jgi:iron-sulfur cluster assembly protein
MVDAPEEDDKIFEFEDIKVCIDRKSILVLKGTQIDYVDTLMTSGFKLGNPASKHTCGCGESFSI